MPISVRTYRHSDCDKLSELFFETVHAVNAGDYTQEQLFAWARDKTCLQRRRSDLDKQLTLVAEIDGAVVGFGSIDRSGYLDLLFVHKDFQRQSVATALCDRLEQGFPHIRTHASITAKPFFEKRGYTVVEAQEVERGGVKLKNYRMQKENLN